MTSSAVVRPIETNSLPELVTVELRRAILSGRLAPGSSFSLRKIAEMLQATAPGSHRSTFRSCRPSTGSGASSSRRSAVDPAC